MDTNFMKTTTVGINVGSLERGTKRDNKNTEVYK